MLIWERSERMATLFEGVGFILTILGGAAAESQSTTIPVIMIAAGVAMMAVGYLEERRWN